MLIEMKAATGIDFTVLSGRQFNKSVADDIKAGLYHGIWIISNDSLTQVDLHQTIAQANTSIRDYSKVFRKEVLFHPLGVRLAHLTTPDLKKFYVIRMGHFYLLHLKRT